MLLMCLIISTILLLGLTRYDRRFVLNGYLVVLICVCLLWMGYGASPLLLKNIGLILIQVVSYLSVGAIGWGMLFLSYHLRLSKLQRCLLFIAGCWLIITIIFSFTNSVGVRLSWLIIGYFAVGFVAYIVGTLLDIISFKRRATPYLLVLGSGLRRDGSVSQVLQWRLDRTVRLYRQLASKPKIIVSGGQGSDEPRTEAAAMAEYLRNQKIPGDRIIQETKATSTFENLSYTKQLISDDLTIITSNFHIFRTGLYARRLHISCQLVSAPTPPNYLLWGTLREYIALVAMYRWWHLAISFSLVIIGGFLLR
ncbi:YdcF family protein [Loigolactobacillus iwatensis]|uniref:YdcF family protein n=1 Tax=Loigolactobacillus iwatensis TaxID=1267156 RepID=UPI000F7E8364|nr:YdcF family protein [Loigolactobacillus iwatensis]